MSSFAISEPSVANHQPQRQQSFPATTSGFDQIPFEDLLKDQAPETKAEKIARLNAPIAGKREHERAKHEHMVERILEVGVEQYIEEQKEVEKLMKLLAMMASEMDEEMKVHLQHFREQFESHPPDTVEQMYAYMDNYVADLRDEDLQERLMAVLSAIRDKMESGELELVDSSLGKDDPDEHGGA